MRALLLCLFLFSLTNAVQAKGLHFVLSSDSNVVMQTMQEIRSTITSKDNDLDIDTSLANDFSGSDVANDDLIVAIGNKAAKTIIDSALPNQLIISYTDSQTNRYIQQHRKHDNISVISLHQPSKSLIQLSDSVSEAGYKKSLLIAVSEQNESLLSELNALAPLSYGELNIVIIPQQTIAAKVLEPHLFNAAVLVAIQDPEIWSGKNANWLLQQAFNYQVPVIGYSKSFLKAGALASVYSTIKDVTALTVESINHWLDDELSSSFSINYPEAAIAINPSIAKVYPAAAAKINAKEKTQ